MLLHSFDEVAVAAGVAWGCAACAALEPRHARLRPLALRLRPLALWLRPLALRSRAGTGVGSGELLEVVPDILLGDVHALAPEHDQRVLIAPVRRDRLQRHISYEPRRVRALQRRSRQLVRVEGHEGQGVGRVLGHLPHRAATARRGAPEDELHRRLDGGASVQSHCSISTSCIHGIELRRNVVLLNHRSVAPLDDDRVGVRSMRPGRQHWNSTEG
mmetsp:Transcript_10043/g.23861  ORF Transcript_10043/g.23861 Transcript_10043/m.23861 type:complete len:216 (-) Transcript_10043:111-758(-)